MMYFILWIGLSMVIGSWASAWNRSFVSWTIISLIFSPLIGAIVLAISGYEGKKCPKCSESVKSEALICKHCGSEFKVVVTPAILHVPTVNSGVFKVCIMDFSNGKLEQICFDSESIAREAWVLKRTTLKSAKLLRFKSAVYDPESCEFTGESDVMDSVG